jgi:cytochrome c oxidase assembly protein subunit 15
MSRRARVRERLAVTPERYFAITLVALVALTVIVFTGAAVRVTGSGLGCPEWPKCEPTSLTPESTGAPVLIEFGNRLLTFAVSAAVLAAVLFAWTRRPFRRDLLLLAAILPVGVLVQGVIGGISVLVDLHFWSVMLHYMASIALLVPALVLAWRASEPGDRPRPPAAPDRRTARQVRLLCASALLSLFAGTAATAAGPHSGGDGTGDVVERLELVGDDTARLVIGLHGLGAFVLGLSVLGAWAVARRRNAGPGLQRPLTVALALIAVQGALGLVQYALELPDLPVWAHVCLATVLWNALVWSALAAGRPGAVGDAPPPGTPAVTREPAAVG